MTKKKINEILKRMDEAYGTEIKVYLEHDNSWQLLVATILSAQCTDKRVNEITKALFKKYTSPKAFAEANLEELENDIKSAGFYHNKALSIKESMNIIHERYNDEVPRSIEELTSLPGVGRKTANVIRGNIYNDPSIVVDTHVKRISRKLGLTQNTDPVKVEYDLMKTVPEDHWILVNKQMIAHGRTICKAPTPLCDCCFLRDLCNQGSHKEKK